MEAEPARAPGRAAPYPVSDKTAFREIPMAWFLLVLSGLLEAVWATALSRSAGLSRLGPSVVFAVSLVASMAGLAYALRTLPVGTSYAVWVGIGAATTAAVAMATGAESVSVVRIALLTGIVACVAGLKLTT